MLDLSYIWDSTIHEHISSLKSYLYVIGLIKRFWCIINFFNNPYTYQTHISHIPYLKTEDARDLYKSSSSVHVLILVTHKLWSWNFSVNLLFSSLERDIWFWWVREGCWCEMVLSCKNKERGKERNKESVLVQQRRQGKIIWVGHMFAKGKRVDESPFQLF